MVKVSNLLLSLVVGLLLIQGFVFFYGGFVNQLGADPGGQLQISSKSNSSITLVQNLTDTFGNTEANVGIDSVFGGIKGLFEFITLPFRLIEIIPSLLADFFVALGGAGIQVAWVTPYLIPIISIIVLFAIYAALTGKES